MKTDITTLDYIGKLSTKYKVEIDLKFRKNRFLAMINNEEESHVVTNGFTINLMEDIESKCIEMKGNEDTRMREIDSRLGSMHSDIFPENLFNKG